MPSEISHIRSISIADSGLDRLISKLKLLGEPAPASCFVLLWTFFEKYGLQSAENKLRANNIPPWKLNPFPPSSDFLTSKTQANLINRIKSSLEDREIFALQWLTTLDRDLAKLNAATFPATLLGIDDESYRIRARNNFIAETYHGRHERIAWAADQSLSLARYTPVHTIVPYSKSGLRVNCHEASYWADPYIKDRINAAKNSLKVMLWPFQTHVKYPALQNIHTCRPGDFFCLNAIQNEGEIEKEVIRAFQQAKESKITILIFPELCFTEAIKEAAIRELAGYGRKGYPILTVFGCCHQREIGKNLDLNIATMLDPDGTHLHRHQKLSAYSQSSDEGITIGEQIDVGRNVDVFESDIGNFTPLICLDLFNEQVQPVIKASSANILLVPSLSQKTTAHETAAKAYRSSFLGSTFVCNRKPFWDESPKTGSFFLVPRKKNLFHSMNRANVIFFNFLQLNRIASQINLNYDM